jgi:hypothetical protein
MKVINSWSLPSIIVDMICDRLAKSEATHG